VTPDDFERRLADSLQYGAVQAGPVDAAADLPVAVAGRRPGWRWLFERRLAESLRYGASKARPVPGRPVEAPPRAGRRRPPRGLVVVLAGLVAVLVIALPAVLLADHQRGQPRAVPTGRGGTASTLAPGGPRVAPPPWQLDAGLYGSRDGTQPLGREVTMPRGGVTYLIVRVTPAHVDGKTYLQRRLTDGSWLRLGPHNTYPDSRVIYALRPPPTGTSAAYRVYVPAALGHGDTYSAPVVLHAPIT